MKHLTFIAIAIFLTACGHEKPKSNFSSEESKSSFTTQYTNNTNRGFDSKVINEKISVTNAYLHIPSNNLYGNRYLIADFKVLNQSFSKQINIAVDAKWKTANFAAVPSMGPQNGGVYARHIKTEGEYDHFSIVLHEIIFNKDPQVEIKVGQNGREEYVKIQLREADRVYEPVRSFNAYILRDELKIDEVSTNQVSGSTFVKMELDIKDLNAQKLFVVECIECSGINSNKKVIQFIEASRSRTQDGAVFIRKVDGREFITLYVSFPSTANSVLRKLRVTYIAPGYLGAPTLGNHEGVYGVPYALDLEVDL